MGITKRAGRSKNAEQAQPVKPGRGKSGQARAVFDTTRKKDVGVSDLTLISKITNEAINDNLKLRFENAEIYTYIGHVLVSVNPFRDLGIYADEVKKTYQGKNRLESSPHVFAIAESAYHHIQSYHENQCVIISGESGAGKTEAAKRMMEYIAQRSGESEAAGEIKKKVLATNPLLESFGNAKTLRNNNSSRFGKYLELQFKEQNVVQDPKPLEPVGATITNYLLEKSRVVGQTTNERNFHIFYQLTKAAPADVKERYQLDGPQSFEYLRRSKCLDVPGIDDMKEYEDMITAMDTINITDAERDNIFRMLATILWIGNVTFVEDDSGNAAIADTNALTKVARFLGVQSSHVLKAFTLRIVETSRGGRRGSVYEVPLNVVQATAVRDALAKAIYFNLFDWIVHRLNKSLAAEGQVDNTVGILDIYGFEIFDKNSFEQLCINYVNEKLQQIFIQLTLRTEQEEYAREQIQWTPIKYFDNKIVCDLIEEKRPPGVFAALNDACATAHADSGAADQTFVQRLNFLSSNPHFQPRQGQFVIKHYAGDVNYSIDGITDKNKDQLLKDLLNLVAESKYGFVKELFPSQVNQDDKRRPPTAGDKIKASANDLVATLIKATPSYIRTIKPNENKSPSEYNTGNVMHQVKYLGLQENVRIRRAGFAYRQTFEAFFDRFFLLCPEISSGSTIREDWKEDLLTGVHTIIKNTSLPKEEYQLGVSKIFIKSPEAIFGLEALRDRHFVSLVIRIQRVWKKIYKRMVEDSNTIKRAWRRAHGGDEFLQLRDYGHQVLQGRKERRRFSLIGSRRYLGDYLGINNRGGYGEHVRNSINLSGHERVLFSCRCELLVTKFGRSSKPEPRMLALTNKAVYIIAVTVVNKQPSIVGERTIPLGAIRFVGTSTLKDDWCSIGVSSPQEPDPLICCAFKSEFFTHLSKAIPGGGLNLKIAESIEFNKKPGKPSVVKTVKDPSVQRDDYYKSGTIHTGQGEPASSSSRPTPRRKAGQGRARPRPKFIRPGGPSGKPSSYKPRPTASKAPVPVTHSRVTNSKTVPSPRPVPTVTKSQSQITTKPVAAISSIAHKQNESANRAPPPPPPPPAASRVEEKELYRVKFDFQEEEGTPKEAGKLYARAGVTVEVLETPNQGWWFARLENGTSSGWIPELYLEPYVPEPPQIPAAPPAPPPPPARAVPPAPNPQTNGINGGTQAPKSARPTPPLPPKRPATKGRKPPAPPTPRDSALSMGTSGSGSGRATPDNADGGKQPGMAADIAKLLAQRSASMQGKKANDDDW